jgi:hypothetical protein
MPASDAPMPPSFMKALDELVTCETDLAELPAPARSILMSTDDVRLPPDTTIGISRPTFAAACASLHAPRSYLLQLPAQVQRLLLQYHLGLNFGEGEVVYVLARDDQFVGMRDPKLLALKASEVLCVAAAALRDRGEIRVIGPRWPTPTTVEFELIVHKINTEVNVGDVVEGGIRVTHSITGHHATWVHSFVFRKVCKNGMVARECIETRGTDGARILGPRTRRLPANMPSARERQLAQIARLVDAAVSGLDARLSRLHRLANEKVNVEALFVGFLRRARLPNATLLPLLRNAWQKQEGGGTTRWHAANSFTWVATHERGLSAHVLRSLATLGGIVAFESEHVCPRCFAHLAGPIANDESNHPHHGHAHT